MAAHRAEVTSWGRSMYGGWYCNFWYDGEHVGISADSKRELVWELQDYGGVLDDDLRYDN